MTPKSKKLLCLFHEYTVPLRGRRPEPPSKAPCSWGKCRGSPKSSPTCSCPSHPALCHLAPDVTVNHAYHILGFQGQHVPALPPGNATPQSLPSPTSDQMATIPLGFSVLDPPEMGGLGPGPRNPTATCPQTSSAPRQGRELVKEVVPQSQDNRRRHPPLLFTTSSSREGVQLKAGSQGVCSTWGCPDLPTQPGQVPKTLNTC